MIRPIWKFLTFTFNGALMLLGAAIGGASIAAMIGRFYGIDFPEFPATIIGLYENFRSIVFVWVPEWVPVFLSDIVILYLVIAFACLRGVLAFNATDGKGAFTDTELPRIQQFTFFFDHFLVVALVELYSH